MAFVSKAVASADAGVGRPDVRACPFDSVGGAKYDPAGAGWVLKISFAKL